MYAHHIIASTNLRTKTIITITTAISARPPTTRPTTKPISVGGVLGCVATTGGVVVVVGVVVGRTIKTE